MVYVSGDEHRVREVPRFFKIIPFVIFNREVTDGLRLSRKVARLCDAYGRILDRQDGEQRGDGCRRWIKFQPRAIRLIDWAVHARRRGDLPRGELRGETARRGP